MQEKVLFQDLGNISYQNAWDYQTTLQNEAIKTKINNRDNENKIVQKNHLIFCEHTPVYTLGKSGSLENLLLNEKELIEKGIDFFKINRGGDITYHGPGQIVAYPIFDLELFFTDVHKYVRCLEESVILTCKEYGLNPYREEGFTGVWLPQKNNLPKRKICAIGVHLSRWITMHGLAFNVNTDLDYFKNIIPCGIDDPEKDVTSLSFEIGEKIDINNVKERLKYHFSEVFDFQYV